MPSVLKPPRHHVFVRPANGFAGGSTCRSETLAAVPGVKGRSGGHNRLSVEEHRFRGTFRPARHGTWTPGPAVDGAVRKPSWLSSRAGAVWDTLAPIAQALGTLTPADVVAFATLCEL